MPGFRTRKNRRNKYTLKRRNRKVSTVEAKSKTSAKAQSNQIVKLQKQISSLNYKVKGNTQWAQYAYKPPSIVHSGGTLAPEPAIQRLVVPSAVPPGPQWDRLFNSTQDTEDNLKWHGKYMQLEYCYELSNPTVSGVPITITTFIVSLKRETAQQVLQSTNFLTTLTENEHYSKNSMGTVQGSGMVFVNRSLFKVHHVSMCTIGHKTNFQAVDDVETTTLKDNRYRRYIRLPYKCLLKGDWAGMANSWKSLTYETLQPTDQRFFLTFANNYGDQGLQISLNGLFSGVTTN